MPKSALVLFAFVTATIGLTPTSNAAGPFGLFGGKACCDTACDVDPCRAETCDADPCQPECCDADPCEAASCDAVGCALDGCDAPCGPKCHRIGSRLKLLDRCGKKACDEQACCCPKCSYCSIFGGWNTLDEYSGERVLPAQQLQGTFNDGWAIGVARGRRLNRAIRGELEFAFRSNTADVWTVNGASNDWSGHLFTYSGMANLYHDFNNWDLAGFKPYIGGGIGLAVFDGDFQTAATAVEIEDAEFAYQFIAGASRQLNCNVDLFTEYRFFGTTEVEVMDIGAAPDERLGQLEPEFHNVFIGLRIFR